MTYLIPMFWQAFDLLVYIELQIHIPISNLLISNIIMSFSKIWVKKEYLLELFSYWTHVGLSNITATKSYLHFPSFLLFLFISQSILLIILDWDIPFIFDYSLNGLLFVFYSCLSDIGSNLSGCLLDLWWDLMYHIELLASFLDFSWIENYLNSSANDWLVRVPSL